LPFAGWPGETRGAAKPFRSTGGGGAAAESNGLSFMRARYYSPPEGRFLSIDPLRVSPPNLYAYVDNNPLQFVDPLGLQGAAGFAGGITSREKAIFDIGNPNTAEHGLRQNS